MISMNPSLSAAALTAQTQQSGSNLKAENSTPEPTEQQKSASNGNSSVTLSDASVDNSVDYSDLAQSQTVRSAEGTENRSSEANQTNSGSTYASSLQLQANYLANQQTGPQEQPDVESRESSS